MPRPVPLTIPRDVPSAGRPLADGRALFPRGIPAVEDVVQGALGDCALLAATKAVLLAAGGPAYLHGLFREAGDVVVVTLYLPPSFRLPGVHRATYAVAVPRTRLLGPDGEDLNPASAPWVLALERAYAAARLHEVGRGPVRDARDVVAALDGGDPRDAFQAILGVRCADRDPTAVLRAALVLPAASPVLARLLGTPRGGVLGVGGRLGGLATYFDDATNAAHARWLTRDVADAWEGFAAGFSVDPGGRAVDGNEWRAPLGFARQDGLRHGLRLEDVGDFLEARACPAGVRAAILGALRGERVLPGKRGTGLYSGDQLAVFELLRDALARGTPVAAVTRPFVGASDPARDGRGATPRPGLVKGLYPEHVYAVEAAREEDGVRYVHLVNPHERVGRVYDGGDGGVLRARGAELPGAAFEAGARHGMRVELGDFTKRFATLDIAKAPGTKR